MTWDAVTSNDWTPVEVREVLVVYRYEIEPRPAALGGGVRLYLYGPDQETGRDRAGRRRLSVRAGRTGDQGGVCRGSVGRGFLARLAALLLKATLSVVNCFWSFARQYLLSG